MKPNHSRRKGAVSAQTIALQCRGRVAPEVPAPVIAAGSEAIRVLNRTFTDPTMLRRRRIGVAHHEAGHIFAAHHFNFPLQECAAELTGQESSLGLAHFHGEDLLFDGSSQARCRAEEAIVVLLSGGAAHAKLFKRYESAEYWGASDRDQAKRVIEAITPEMNDDDMPWLDGSLWWEASDEGRSYLRVLEYRAMRLVSKNWDAITRLAKALLHSGRLKADQVHQIIAGA